MILILWSCSRQNLAEEYTENTPEETARGYLNEEQWEEAIEAYRELIVADPERYDFYPLLATCYAGRGGIDLVNAVKEQFSSDSDSGSVSLFDSLDSFVPKSPTEAQVLDVDAAIDTLEAMPFDHRNKESTYTYGTEAFGQLNLYRASYSAMVVNRYSGKDDEGNVSREDLENMSEEEVDGLLSQLENISESGDEELGPAVQEALADIEATEGETQKEKLINYIANN